MNSEKVKEIKKALECCSTLMDNNATSEEQDNACNECPYRINDRCSWNLDSDALTLINKLESENDCKDIEISRQEYQIEKLKDRIAELEKDNETLRNAKVVYENVDYCYEDLKKAKKRIAELETKNEVLCVELSRYTENCIEMKNGTLKQFAERLKSKDCSVPVHEGFILIEDHAIDETLKEFINKGDEEQ